MRRTVLALVICSSLFAITDSFTVEEMKQMSRDYKEKQ